MAAEAPAVAPAEAPAEAPGPAEAPAGAAGAAGGGAAQETMLHNCFAQLRRLPCGFSQTSLELHRIALNK